MGAAASAQLATEFFEESRRAGCPPPIYLDMNMDTKKVTEEGVKLMPGGALIVPSLECPLHQIGDGKGVSGRLRTVDSSKYKPSETSKLMSSSRFLNHRSRTQKAHEGKPLAKSLKEAVEHNPQPGAAVVPDFKTLFMIDEESKHGELFKTQKSSTPESSIDGHKTSVVTECQIQQGSQAEPSPLLKANSIPSVLTQASPPVMNLMDSPFMKEVSTSLAHDSSALLAHETSAPLARETSCTPSFPRESPVNHEIRNITPVLKGVGMDRVIQPAPNVNQAPDEPHLLSNSRPSFNTATVSSDSQETWNQPSQQTFYNSMLRKGWVYHEADMSSESITNVMKVYSANHELAWREVLKWEALHADECKDPKLKSCSSLATKYSPRALVRSWFGYSLPFDRHDWIIDRNGKDVRYIIDFYDGGKFNNKFEFALLYVRPALDSFEALWDRLRVAIRCWTSESGDSLSPGNRQVPEITSINEPLNIGSKQADKLKGQKSSQFMSYNLSDVEKENEKKNSVS